MRWCLIRISVSVLLLLGAASASAQEGPPVRLRARTFVPPPNLARAVTSSPSLLAPGGRRHVLIQFSRPIDPADLDRLRAAGATPLRYVPDHTIAAAVPSGFTATGIDGARWMGELEPADRLSAESARALTVETPAHPWTVVEFHPDTDPAAVAALLAEAGATPLPSRALPPYAALVPTEASILERLARMDAVAWIFPAAPELQTASAAALCDGLVRAEGIVANYAAMGDGWDGAGRGAATLRYFLAQPSADLDTARQRQEIVRAMAEWGRYAEVDWQPAATAAAARSVTVLWGPADHGDGYPFTPAILAHAFYPAPLVAESIAGDVHFNDTLSWGAGDPQRWDVFSVALHELGHSLGLVHSADPGSVMYAMYRGIVAGLSEVDIRTIREVYAPRGPDALPATWMASVVGADSAGGVTEADGRITIRGAGRDIWDSADEFRFVWQRLAGDGEIVARLDALTGIHRWSKAGLMIRAAQDPGAAHGFVFVSQGRGLAFQRRRESGGLSLHTAGEPATAPRWLWLSRRGNRIEAYSSADGGEWQLIGFDEIALDRDALVGMAVTSHVAGRTAEATFSSVTVSPRASAWLDADIGAVGLPGTSSQIGSEVRVTAAGEDIWGQRDAFHLVWQSVEGNVDVTARLTSIGQTRAWTKAGVMIRGALTAGAPHGFMLGSARKGFAFQRRPVQDGLSVHSGAGLGSAPGWLRLSRRGDRLIAYRSNDGAVWTEVGSDVVPMGRLIFVGLAVSSHTAETASYAVFDNVAIVPVR
jgi:regulation of enolase protein 1 (concanavalin A-like superfamily)